MLERVKKIIAELQLSQLSRKQKPAVEKFNDFFTLSNSILLVFPLKDDILSILDELINYMISQGKKITVFSTVEYFNKISLMNKCGLLEYAADEINRFGLPNGYLQRRLQREKYDVVINLDSTKSLFNMAITKLTNSKYRVGFSGAEVDKYFNIQISKKSDEPNYLAIVNTLNLF